MAIDALTDKERIWLDNLLKREVLTIEKNPFIKEMVGHEIEMIEQIIEKINR